MRACVKEIGQAVKIFRAFQTIRGANCSVESIPCLPKKVTG